VNSLHQSLLIHGLIASLFLFLYLFKPKQDSLPIYEFKLMEAIPVTPKATQVVPEIALTKKPSAPPPPVTKQVFGIHRKAVTGDSGVAVKAGNTLAKEVDQTKLSDDDPDSLPIPAEEYLVTSMPQIKNEFKIPYPPEAREKGITGKVILDILIDSEGKVRQASLVKGLGFGLDEAALVGVKNFEFSPAKVGNQKVAVKIRYAINFVLE
jgi:periplasmic protein TonB